MNAIDRKPQLAPDRRLKYGEDQERILTVRLGALGDLILCFQAFHEIRCHHSGVEIALLTTPAFKGFATLMPWFDRILIDDRPPLFKVNAWHRLVHEIKDFNPARIYDLQGKFRQTILYGLLDGPWGPEWSGAAPWCAFPRPWPPKAGMHYTDFVAAQLRAAHVPPQPPPSLAWLDAPLPGFELPERFAILAPSCAPGRNYKKWPSKHYSGLVLGLAKKGIKSVLIGTDADRPTLNEVLKGAPNAIDFGGRTSLPQLAAMARRSVAVIGNDTGPVHLAAAVGARTLALLSDKVKPAWSSPKGLRARWLQGRPLEALGVNEVFLALMNLIDKS